MNINKLRRADQKLRKGDSISTAELRLLREHYKVLEDASSILPQFYCAHQEAVRRLNQVETYLNARDRKVG